MKNRLKRFFLFVLLLNSFSVSHGYIMKAEEGGVYMLSGIAVGAGAAALGANIPVSTGLGLLVTYLYLNRPSVPTVDTLLEDTGVEIVDDKQGVSLLLPIDTMFRGPITNPIIDVKYYSILNTVVQILQLCDPVSIKVTGSRS